MNPDLNLIGPRIRQLREHRELSVAALAQRTGCSAEMIAALEAGELVPSLTPLFRLARGLGVRLGTLLAIGVDEGDAHQFPPCNRAASLMAFKPSRRSPSLV